MHNILTEINKKMKLSTTIVLLSIASYTFAQTTHGESRSTKIDENEKKRLENQFKALNTFYINDDGLVVYQTQGNSTSQDNKEESADTIRVTSSVPSEKVRATEGNDNYSTPKESKETTNTYTPTEEPNIIEKTAPEKAYARPNIIKKIALRPTEADTSTATEASQTKIVESAAIKNSPITAVDEEPKSTLVKLDSDKSDQKKTTSKKASVFDKKKYTPQYKTMEEAALAVEALLEDLRKEQSQTTSAGSMSSRLSGGAGRATLRKKAAVSPSYSSTNSNNAKTKTPELINEEENSEFGIEPTYYINGKEVDKIEINKLRKKEIINKEVRTRNTVSGNPNGEVWYEVKYDN